MYTHGDGKYEQQGHVDKENRTSSALVHALEGKYITQVQCGWRRIMALTSSDYVFTWGSSEYSMVQLVMLIPNLSVVPYYVQSRGCVSTTSSRSQVVIIIMLF